MVDVVCLVVFEAPVIIRGYIRDVADPKELEAAAERWGDQTQKHVSDFVEVYHSFAAIQSRRIKELDALPDLTDVMDIRAFFATCDQQEEPVHPALVQLAQQAEGFSIN